MGVGREAPCLACIAGGALKGGCAQRGHKLITSDGRDSEKKNRLEQHRSSVSSENFKKICDFAIFSL